ncbi:unnamed protein product, partial [Trichogramma brassicae]
MPHVSSSGGGGDDLGSEDEVKVFKDEGEDEKRSSENLTEEKSSLIDLTESEVLNLHSRSQCCLLYYARTGHRPVASRHLPPTKEKLIQRHTRHPSTWAILSRRIHTPTERVDQFQDCSDCLEASINWIPLAASERDREEEGGVVYIDPAHVRGSSHIHTHTHTHTHKAASSSNNNNNCGTLATFGAAAALRVYEYTVFYAQTLRLFLLSDTHYMASCPPIRMHCGSQSAAAAVAAKATWRKNSCPAKRGCTYACQSKIYTGPASTSYAQLRRLYVICCLLSCLCLSLLTRVGQYQTHKRHYFQFQRSESLVLHVRTLYDSYWYTFVTAVQCPRVIEIYIHRHTARAKADELSAKVCIVLIYAHGRARARSSQQQPQSTR